MEWAEEIVVDGVGERSFVLHRSTSQVPGVVWRPAGSRASCALVMLGHGGSGHKRSDRVRRVGRWLATNAGIASVAIDGPFHGDRALGSAMSYQTQIAAEGAEAVVDRMTDDWLAVRVAVSELADVDRLGYFGLSMGTRYGIPTAARLGDRLRCAVFGKFGLEQTSALPAALDTTSRIRVDAPRVAATCLFHIQWDDDRFTRAGQLALFDLLGSNDKRLIAYPGGHAETHPAAEPTWQSFLCEQLAPSM